MDTFRCQLEDQKKKQVTIDGDPSNRLRNFLARWCRKEPVTRIPIMLQTQSAGDQICCRRIISSRALSEHLPAALWCAIHRPYRNDFSRRFLRKLQIRLWVWVLFPYSGRIYWRKEEEKESAGDRRSWAGWEWDGCLPAGGAWAGCWPECWILGHAVDIWALSDLWEGSQVGFKFTTTGLWFVRVKRTFGNSALPEERRDSTTNGRISTNPRTNINICDFKFGPVD